MMYLGIDFHGYKVSESGVVTKNNKIMKHFIDEDGYQRIALTVNGKQKKFYVHRLVHELYLGPISKGHVCCHKDGTRTNNHFSNLRSGTQKSNIADKLQSGTWQAGDTHPATKYDDKTVLAVQIFMKVNPHLGDTYVSKVTKLPRHLIYDIRRGRRKTRDQRINERQTNDVSRN